MERKTQGARKKRAGESEWGETRYEHDESESQCLHLFSNAQHFENYQTYILCCVLTHVKKPLFSFSSLLSSSAFAAAASPA